MTNGSQLSITLAITGKAGRYACNGMSFPVKIVDARRVYGRVDALITPVGGDGETWVEASKIKLD